MVHTLKSIARNYNFDEKDFEGFAKTQPTLAWEDTLGAGWITNTWWVDELIKLYKEHLKNA